MEYVVDFHEGNDAFSEVAELDVDMSQEKNA